MLKPKYLGVTSVHSLDDHPEQFKPKVKCLGGQAVDRRIVNGDREFSNVRSLGVTTTKMRKQRGEIIYDRCENLK